MKNESAYTLIELLVGISIISIIFLVGFASFREFSRRQELDGVTKNVYADLRLAQQLALTGDKPEACSTDTLEGYIFSPSSKSYSIIADCNTLPDVEVKKIDITDPVTLSGSNVEFKVLGQGTNLSSMVTYTITHDVTGDQQNVYIGIRGNIN